MIVGVDNSENQAEFQTDGCGCCSVVYYKGKDDKKIIDNIDDNIRIAKKACDAMGINFKKLCDESD